MGHVFPKAKKFRGQHFLVDQNMLKKIVAAADIKPTDTVVEVGAGTGNLTVHLAARAKRVIAIEIDNDLVPVLRGQCAQYSNVEIIHDDARTFDPTNYKLQTTNYLVVANIPYNITSLLLRMFLEADPPPTKMILLIQKEVASRICAHPPFMSLLSVAVQYYAEPHILFSVPRTCFSPRPRVDSAVIQAIPHNGEDGYPFSVPDFFTIVTTGFAHKRKLLISNLVSVFPIPRDHIVRIFETLHISSTARAQELSLGQWKGLRAALSPLPRVGKAV